MNFILKDKFDVFIGINKNQFKTVDSNIGYEYNMINSLNQNLLLNDIAINKEILTKPIDLDMLIKKDDIVAKLIGDIQFYYINYEPYMTFVTSSFCIIRKKPKTKTPSLCLWTYLNSNYFKNDIKKKMQGNFYSYVLKISDIQNMNIYESLIDNDKSDLFYKYQLLMNLNNQKKILLNRLVNTILDKGK